jgi:hypothetical protein
MTRQQTTNVIVPYSDDKYHDHMAIMTLMLSHYRVYKGLDPHRDFKSLLRTNKKMKTFSFLVAITVVVCWANSATAQYSSTTIGQTSN